MLYLSRKQFLDRIQSVADIQRALSTWARLFHLATPGAIPHGSVTAEIWGFPKADSERLRDMVRQSAATYGFADTCVEMADPHTLRISGPISTANPLPDCSSWLNLCLGASSGGLVCSFRAAVKDRPNSGETMDGRGAILVLDGQERDGWFLLKAVRPGYADRERERVFEYGPWPEEAQFVTLVDSPPSSFDKAPAWVEALVASGAARQVDSAITWFLMQRDRGLAGFLARIFAAGFPAAILITLFNRLRAGSSPALAWTLVGPMALAAIAALLFKLVEKGWLLWAYRTNMRAGLAKLYSHSLAYHDVDPTTLEAWSDPTARKYSADLLAAGAAHFLDTTAEPPAAGTRFVRHFLVPDGCTCFSLSPTFGVPGSVANFPARPLFFLDTRLADGTQVVTTNQRMGYRKPLRLDRLIISRHYPGTVDAEEMIQMHDNLVRRLESDRGQKRAALDTASLKQRMSAEHDESAAAMARYGYYRWGDAFHEVFDMVRREYRD